MCVCVFFESLSKPNRNSYQIRVLCVRTCVSASFLCFHWHDGKLSALFFHISLLLLAFIMRFAQANNSKSTQKHHSKSQNIYGCWHESRSSSSSSIFYSLTKNFGDSYFGGAPSVCVKFAHNLSRYCDNSELALFRWVGTVYCALFKSFRQRNG